MPASAWTIGLGVTSKCNMRCPFCYSQDQRTARELALDDWVAFFRKNGSQIRAVNYGTGENTLSRTWYQIIEFVRRQYPGVTQALTTNGHLAEAVKDPGLRRTVEACIDEIDVSIDFARAERHDRWRGFPGAFERAVRTLAFCRASGKRVTIVILGEKETLDVANLARIFNLARRYGAYVRINLYRHVNRRSPCRAPSLAEVLKALDWIVARHPVVSISEPVFKSLYGIPAVPGVNGSSSLRILSDGSITPSTYLITEEWIAGRIQNGARLADIGRTEPFRRFRREILPLACKDCRHGETCRGGARDRRFLAWGSLEEPDIYCPRRDGSTADQAKRPAPRLLIGEDTVHSDYLPTMIFSPSRNGSGHASD